MKFSILAVVLLVSSAALLVSGEPASNACSEQRTLRYSRCAKKLIFLGGNKTVPSSVPLMKQYCGSTKGMVRCVKEYTRNCMDGLAKTTVNFFMYQTGKLFKSVCKTGELLQSTSENLACLVPVNGEISGVFDQLVNELRLIATMSDKQRIPAVCCRYHYFIANVVEVSSKTCNEDQTKFLLGFIDQLAKDVIDLLCSNTSTESQTCKSLVLPDVKLEDDPNASLIPSFVEVVKAF